MKENGLCTGKQKKQQYNDQSNSIDLTMKVEVQGFASDD